MNRATYLEYFKIQTTIENRIHEIIDILKEYGKIEKQYNMVSWKEESDYKPVRPEDVFIRDDLIEYRDALRAWNKSKVIFIGFRGTWWEDVANIEIPLNWLFLSNGKINASLEAERVVNEEKKRTAASIAKSEKEAKDRAEYERLRKQFSVE